MSSLEVGHERASGAGSSEAPSRDQPRAGDRIASFELIERIGTGGQGTIWRAKHVSLDHQVAIKFLLPAAGRSAQARFRREARLASRISAATRHITHIVDHGILPNGTPFLVMELLDGETLEEVLAQRGSLPFDVAVAMAVQVCRALVAVHAKGVVHRDVNPSNIFFCRSDDGSGLFVKLLDFGLAKSNARAQSFTTDQETVLGTIGYISPEYLRGTEIGPRADLWSLAAVVYRAVLGRPAFTGTQRAELQLGRLTQTLVPPTQLRSDLPKALDAWMLKALALRPEERFQSAGELGSALEEVAGIAPAPEPPRAVPRRLLKQVSIALLLLTVFIAGIASGVYVIAPHVVGR